MNQTTIDLNCDLGERDDAAGIACDLAILDVVTSANIACGGHAGDEQSMLRTVTAAMERGVALGAHPGYPDRRNFGRVDFPIAQEALEDSVSTQVDRLLRMIDRCGGTLTHVKPHGALYHDVMQQPDVAETFVRGIARVVTSVTLIGQAGAPALDIWRSTGWCVAAEAFADRRYQTDGSLLPRNETEAVIEDAAMAAAQAVNIAQGLGIRIAPCAVLDIAADTICVHSDSPNAIETARMVRVAIERAGICVRALE